MLYEGNMLSLSSSVSSLLSLSFTMKISISVSQDLHLLLSHKTSLILQFEFRMGGRTRETAGPRDVGAAGIGAEGVSPTFHCQRIVAFPTFFYFVFFFFFCKCLKIALFDRG